MLPCIVEICMSEICSGKLCGSHSTDQTAFNILLFSPTPTLPLFSRCLLLIFFPSFILFVLTTSHLSLNIFLFLQVVELVFLPRHSIPPLFFCLSCSMIASPVSSSLFFYVKWFTFTSSTSSSSFW